ncbi:hypothetical protein GGP48_001936 [Salinibacter ruber]|nr:hypothetical protein [Salinibacter ruber]
MRDGTGGKNRSTVLAERLHGPLQPVAHTM